jgi:hypothetical protein
VIGSWEGLVADDNCHGSAVDFDWALDEQGKLSADLEGRPEEGKHEDRSSC